MKKYFLYFTALFFAANLLAQNLKLHLKPPSPNTYSKKELAQEKKNHECVKKSNKSYAERLKHYPFNKTNKISLVSFSTGNYPKINDSNYLAKMQEIVTLSKLQIDSLTDILYNVGFGGLILRISENQCFNPHNAITFLNKDGKAFAYILICFECEIIETSSEKINFGDLCNQKFELLKQFFIRVGIKYGT